MKKLSLNLGLSALLLLTCVSVAGCSNEDMDEKDVPLTVNDLPTTAQNFLTQFFPNINATNVELEEIGTTFIYEVDLSDGTEIVFNKDGDWQQVDAADGKTIPTGFLLEGIIDYVNDNYSGIGINEINRSGEGYIVELNTADEITLTFNMMGEYTGTISNY